MIATNLIVALAPAEEPVTLTEAKTHLRVDGTDEDTYITRLITGARIDAESKTWRALVTQTLRGYLDCWPAENHIKLPRSPLQSVTHIKYYDASDVATTLATSDYIVSANREPGRITLRNGKSWPSTTLRAADGIEIEFIAGYGLAAAVPELLKQGILLTVGHWFENREDVVIAPGIAGRAIPQGAQSIYRLHKAW